MTKCNPKTAEQRQADRQAAYEAKKAAWIERELAKFTPFSELSEDKKARLALLFSATKE